MKIDEEDYLVHYGTPRHSGRYPWGSHNNEPGGKFPPGHQATRNLSFLDTIKDLERRGWKQKDIAKGLGLSTTELRARKTIATNEKKQDRIHQAETLRAKGMSNGEIAKRMGLPGESSVRALLAPGVREKTEILQNVASALQADVDAHPYIDVGKGVDAQLNLSQEKLGTALQILKNKGYRVHEVKVPQIGTGHDTTMKVLVPPGVTQKDVFLNRDKIRLPSTFTDDGGRHFATKNEKPLTVDPSRLSIKYKEDGGGLADGVVFVRPGVKDLSLGKARYAQVRVKVGDKHYLKGMAMYDDNMPKGTDLLFHTNKSDTGNKLDALKPLEDDPDTPFGTVTKPIKADIGTPHERITSAMNIVNEEGDWSEWSRSLASQFLSKQSPTLAKQQLGKTYAKRQQEYDELNALTNPTVKKKLLNSFADETDSAAVHLEAAALNARQRWHAILPVQSLKPNEVYAPNYRNGEPVVLVRFPHGGTFEIPELTVNNKNREARRLLGDQPPDGIGIHPSVAQRLSGADFDGDTVIVIPNNPRKVKTSKALEGLKDFDPVSSYPAYPGMVKISKDKMQNEMGNVSNLITDMTIRGASHDELARAIRHSMVVIDSEKKNLNYKQSAIDNNIAGLKREYQRGAPSPKTGRPGTGASTLISRARSPIRIPQRKPRLASEGGPIDPTTGRKMFSPTNKMRRDKSGNLVPKLEKVERLALEEDAFKLVSEGGGTPIEHVYAEHSNNLKALANKARLSVLKTPPLVWDSSAKRVYAKEVASLDHKLRLAKQHAPLERQAQVIANANVRAKRQANPNLEGDSLKSIKFKELETARARMKAGRKDTRIDITQEEWNAIQAGAVSNHRLEEILANTDNNKVRQLATPRTKVLMTSSKIKRAEAMFKSGHTRAEVADALGVSLSTLDASIKQGESK